MSGLTKLKDEFTASLCLSCDRIAVWHRLDVGVLAAVAAQQRQKLMLPSATAPVIHATHRMIWPSSDGSVVTSWIWASPPPPSLAVVIARAAPLTHSAALLRALARTDPRLAAQQPRHLWPDDRAAVAWPGLRDTPVVLLAAPDLDAHKGTANAALARFVALHPSNLAQKSEIIVEHFRTVSSKEIGGLGKAMVVTRSRLHAVRYKQSIEAYIKKKGYRDLRALVAFSGKVVDPDLPGRRRSPPASGSWAGHTRCRAARRSAEQSTAAACAAVDLVV